MATIKLEITSGRKSLGSVTLDEEQTKWLRDYALANECCIPSMLKRAIHIAVAPEDRSDEMAIVCPPGYSY